MARTTHSCNKEAEIAVMQEQHRTMAKQIGEIHKTLVGNGRPGIVEEVNRLKNLQRGMFIAGGIIISVLTLVVSAVAAGII